MTDCLSDCMTVVPLPGNNQRAFIKCTVCEDKDVGYFGSVTQFCEHLRKDHADKNIKPYKCSQCSYTCKYGLLVYHSDNRGGCSQ